MIEQILQADRYLQVDQVEKARDTYQRVVDLDPGNAIAVVGLARCALAEGDDRKAYELASRALEIDPENDMARRMEARLSEILTSRGQPVERPAAAASPSPREMREVVAEPNPAGDGIVDGNSERDTATVDDDTPALATADARPSTPTAATARPSPPPTRPAHSTKERAVRKSLFDRLMGR